LLISLSTQSGNFWYTLVYLTSKIPSHPIIHLNCLVVIDSLRNYISVDDYYRYHHFIVAAPPGYRFMNYSVTKQRNSDGYVSCFAL